MENIVTDANLGSVFETNRIKWGFIEGDNKYRKIQVSNHWIKCENLKNHYTIENLI